MLEEVLQSLADGIPLLDGQQMFQLLSKGTALNPNARRKDVSHPLQRAEHRRAGSLNRVAAPREVLLRQRKSRRAFFDNQGGHGSTSLEHGHNLLMRRCPADQDIAHKKTICRNIMELLQIDRFKWFIQHEKKKSQNTIYWSSSRLIMLEIATENWHSLFPQKTNTFFYLCHFHLLSLKLSYC